MARVRTAKITFAVVSDSHKAVANNKLDAVGIFDCFRIWAVPATREFSLNFGIANLRAGDTGLTVWKRVKGEARVLAQIIASSPEAEKLGMSSQRVRIKINDYDDHEIGIGFKGAGPRSITWLPVAIRREPWIELPTGDALKRLLADPHAIRGLRAEVVCEKCKPPSKYMFEINVDPSARRDRGVRPFPASGRFTCPKCRTVHYLKDIEGALRSHIGKSIGEEPK